MYKTKRISWVLIFGIFVASLMQPTGIVVGQEGPFAEMREKMASISETEQESLKSLFLLTQQIQEMEKEEEWMNRDIKAKSREIEDLKVTIAEEEVAYLNKREDLKQVLKSYQRMGTGTYLEIILKSDNLTMLLRRINTLRDLTRNTGKLMELLEETNATLLMEKTNLAEKIRVMEDNQQKLQKSLAKKQQLREDQENYLTSLKDKREVYQKDLANLQQNWDELKTSVPEIIQELSKIIDEGHIPLDEVRITFSLMTVKGAIDQKTINDLILEHPLLPKIEFSFYPSYVEIRMPDKDLVLSGEWVIQETHTIKFQVKEGRFYGIPLDPGAINDLFLKGDLKFNLKLPLSNYTLTTITTTDGSLELTITH